MDGLALESGAFENAQAIPNRHSCEGEEVSPPLRWTNAPEGTRSLALVVDDPDAPDAITAARVRRCSMSTHLLPGWGQVAGRRSSLRALGEMGGMRLAASSAGLPVEPRPSRIFSMISDPEVVLRVIEDAVESTN
jgi:Phosphatidylethanolamine-binding protein